MSTLWQQALADVVRAELALAGRTAKDAYTSLDLSSTAWQRYFKKQDRDIPASFLIDLAAYLGMPLSELVVKTEAREEWLAANAPKDPVDVELLEGMSRGARLAFERERRKGRPSDAEDPSDAATEGVRRAG